METKTMVTTYNSYLNSICNPIQIKQKYLFLIIAKEGLLGTNEIYDSFVKKDYYGTK